MPKLKTKIGYFVCYSWKKVAQFEVNPFHSPLYNIRLSYSKIIHWFHIHSKVQYSIVLSINTKTIKEINLMSSLSMQICATLVLSVSPTVQMFDTIMSDICTTSTDRTTNSSVLTSMICTGRRGQNRLRRRSTSRIKMTRHGSIGVLIHIKGPFVLDPDVGPGPFGWEGWGGVHFNIGKVWVTGTWTGSDTVLLKCLVGILLG